MKLNFIKKRKSLIIVLSAPSGAGKTTICEEIQKNISDLFLSISVTTRKPRENEIDGKDYFFVSYKEFEQYIKNNKLVEWAKVHGEYYGTPQKFLQKCIKENKDVLLEIDVAGGLQIKKKYPESILIFILPPSTKELKTRLYQRHTEKESIIKKRFCTASNEIKKIKKYDYFVINNELKKAVDMIKSIISMEKNRIDRLIFDENLIKNSIFERKVIYFE